jgi:hypothetical protein
MKLPWLRHLSALSKLSLFTVFLLAVTFFTIVSFSLHQQRITSNVWMTTESAKSRCDTEGEAVIAVHFTNTEVDSSQAMNVSVKDVQTGLSIDLGTVGSQQTGTADINTHAKQLSGSSVIFFLTWASNAEGTDQRGATYEEIICAPPVPTPTPTHIPFPTANAISTPKPTVTKRVVADTFLPATEAADTYFVFNVLFHGIGAGGDSVNPKSFGNLNPIHKQRKITVDLYNSKNQLVLSKSGDVGFASPSGNFVGSIDMGKTLADGGYLIKIKADRYLWTSLPGIVSVRAGKENVFPKIALVTGDINNDNVINILDFNLLMGCYSGLHTLVHCDSTIAAAADLTDDNKVDQFDYNLFLSELTISFGK